MNRTNLSTILDKLIDRLNDISQAEYKPWKNTSDQVLTNSSKLPKNHYVIEIWGKE